MKNTISFISCLSVVFCLISCKTTGPKNDSIIYLSPQNISQLKTFDANQIIDSCRYVALETTDSSLIQEIIDLQFSGDNIVIHDETNRLLVFDKNGRFLNQIGKEGKGPGEYLAIRSFYVSNDGSVGLYDPLKAEIYQYSLKGKYIKSYNISKAVRTNMGTDRGENYLKNIFFLEKDKLFCSHYLADKSRCLYSRLNLPNDSLEAISTLKQGFLLPDYITSVSSLPIAHFDNTITFIKPFNDTIFEYSNQELRPKYILSIKEDKRIPDDFLENHIQSTEWGVIRDLAEKKFINIFKFIETKDNLILICIEDGYGKLLFFNKNTQTGCYSELMDGPSENLPFRIQYTDKNGTLIDAQSACSILEMKANNTIGNLEKLPEINEDSNPILVFRYLKKNWSSENLKFD